MLLCRVVSSQTDCARCAVLTQGDMGGFSLHLLVFLIICICMFVIPDTYEVEKHSDPLVSQEAAGDLMFKREFFNL